jgi:toxin ParE1/3/4
VSQIRRSPRASSDLIEIRNYIADDSVASADASVDQLYKTIQVLANQSLSGRRREELAPGIRSFPFGRYMIFYRARRNRTEIIRVLHGSRNIQAIFEG